MFCSQCGKQLENNALFCTFCGKRTNNPNVAPAAVSQPAGTAPAAVQAPIQPATEPVSAENNTTVSENSAPIPAQSEVQPAAESVTEPTSEPAAEPQPEPTAEYSVNSAEAAPAPQPTDFLNNAPISAPAPAPVQTTVPLAPVPEEKEPKYYTFGHIALCLAAVAVMAIVAGVFAGLYFSIV